jgi:hypothetical protein
LPGEAEKISHEPILARSLITRCIWRDNSNKHMWVNRDDTYILREEANAPSRRINIRLLP